MMHPLDLSHIRSLEHAKRALEVAATGAHSLALIGPPGAGKSLLSKALSTLLPPLTEQEYQEVAQQWREEWKRTMPATLVQRCRLSVLPVPTISSLRLAGDGSEQQQQVGLLARHGVLCLDRLDCFTPEVIALLPALFDHQEWASVQLVVTLEPCPCGFYGEPIRECTCSAEQIAQHRRLVAGVLERIALSVEVPRVDYEKLADWRPGETSAQVRERVLAGSAVALRRQGGSNALLSPADIALFCQPDVSGQKLLKAATQQLHFSARSYHRVLCVARTVADLAGCEQIQANHLAEAIQYRPR